MFAVIVFITYFPMQSYPIDIFADSVTFTRCCFRANTNKINIPFLINSVNILFMIFAKTYTTNFTKSLHGEYINWTGTSGSICIKNKYKQHLHSYLSGAQFYNLARFRMGAWKIGKLIVFTFTTLTETNGTVLFVLVITITTLWKTKSIHLSARIS